MSSHPRRESWTICLVLTSLCRLMSFPQAKSKQRGPGFELTLSIQMCFPVLFVVNRSVICAGSVPKWQSDLSILIIRNLNLSLRVCMVMHTHTCSHTHKSKRKKEVAIMRKIYM